MNKGKLLSSGHVDVVSGYPRAWHVTLDFGISDVFRVLPTTSVGYGEMSFVTAHKDRTHCCGSSLSRQMCALEEIVAVSIADLAYAEMLCKRSKARSWR